MLRRSAKGDADRVSKPVRLHVVNLPVRNEVAVLGDQVGVVGGFLDGQGVTLGVVARPEGQLRRAERISKATMSRPSYVPKDTNIIVKVIITRSSPVIS